MTAAQHLNVQQQLDQALTELAHVKKGLAEVIALATGPVAEGIFQPGHTYTLHHARYLCEHLTTDPQTGQLVVWGWYAPNTDTSNPLWGHRAMNSRDFTRWTTAGATDLGPTYLAGEPR
jgi:hypothetical protein